MLKHGDVLKQTKKKYVLNNLHKLVVKEVHGSGGYGLLIRSKSSKKEIEVFKKKIETNPSNFIAQPILELSSVPIFSKRIIPSPCRLKTIFTADWSKENKVS